VVSKKTSLFAAFLFLGAFALVLQGKTPRPLASPALARHAAVQSAGQDGSSVQSQSLQDPAQQNAIQLVAQGRQAFRFDTFGDESFWGGTLMLHQAIEGAKLGGVGPGVSPKTALAVGLKVDVGALPDNLVAALNHGQVNLDDPATTLALLKRNAVVGLTGFFNSSGTLQSVGIQCALCHSTVDNSMPQLCAGAIQPNPGTGCIGRRLEGWSNRDLNVGAIISLALDLSVLANLLSTNQAAVRSVLGTWGPGKFDAELVLDGKASNPQQITDGVVTATNVPGATLIPAAFGLGGVNLHTSTGWGSVLYWNAFVANLAMHGKGGSGILNGTTSHNSPSRRPTALAICRTLIRTATSLLPSCRLFSSTSSQFLLPNRPRQLRSRGGRPR